MTSEKPEIDQVARGQFSEPSAPYPNVLAYSHKHNLTMLSTAQRNPNGTFSSLWGCSECPDIFVGGKVGTIPAGYCRCGWVQKKWPRKKCEECKCDLLKAVDRG